MAKVTGLLLATVAKALKHFVHTLNVVYTSQRDIYDMLAEMLAEILFLGQLTCMHV